ncbi:unnamed protein product [Coffea canephora]|uniref:Uncharacterized protein n=1 Tax=Coffea canephora TaxID=49390 RepID=A0A068V2P0_COFCA|nr:unnamed protein product [Coffea canephora]
MEEEKAAALYDELTRKGGGAARFKQGLGFSSTSHREAVPSRGSGLPSFTSSSSSLLSTFVKASSPSKTGELEKQAQLESIQNKLKKTPHQPQNLIASTREVSRDRDRDSSHSSDRSRSGERERHSRRRSRSPSRNRERHSKRRSRSGSRDDYRMRRRGYRSRSRERESGRRRSSRSESPTQRKSSQNSTARKVEKERNNDGRVEYAETIEGYDKMTPAEKIKARMKFQLSEAAEKDEVKGTGSGWERFDFDRDAPLDDEEIEAVEDDAALVKHIGQSFRFATVEARRDKETRAAHDEAIFGVSSRPADPETAEQEEAGIVKKETHESTQITNLLSDQVLAMQQGSWRHCVRKK